MGGLLQVTDAFVTRAGRRYARPSTGVEVVGVARITGDEIVIAATEEARAILCRADEINYLSGPGKGVILIKLTGKGRELLQRGQFTRVIPSEVENPPPLSS